MEIADRFLYEYAVLRYVPRIEREEFVNIGLIMMNKRCKWLKGKVYLDETKLKAFNPDYDIDALEKQCGLFERTDVPKDDLPIEEKYRWLTAMKSAVLQTSPSHPGLLIEEGDSYLDCEAIKALMEKEFSRLFKELVG
ncbi:MAG: DUF3037 domain-containing protein [Muribaculaceae bacterium]|nr:DUF3037 domain-containing protein [Muribaculaceae bacterium]